MIKAIMKKVLLASVCSVALSACFIPQNFNSNLEVSKTGQYHIKLDSDIISYLYILEQSDPRFKKLTPERQKAELAKLDDEIKKEFEQETKKSGSDIKSFNYLGAGKFHIVAEHEGNIIKEGSHRFIFINLSYSQYKQTISISSDTHLKANNLKELPPAIANMDLNGVINVKTDAKVISDNATTKPFWSLLGSYNWKINKLSEPSMSMVIKSK